jgi:hypothetical protein
MLCSKRMMFFAQNYDFAAVSSRAGMPSMLKTIFFDALSIDRTLPAALVAETGGLDQHVGTRLPRFTGRKSSRRKKNAAMHQ